MIRDCKKNKTKEDDLEYLEYAKVIRNNGELTKWGKELYEEEEKANMVFDPVTKKYYKTTVISKGESDEH